MPGFLEKRVDAALRRRPDRAAHWAALVKCALISPALLNVDDTPLAAPRGNAGMNAGMMEAIEPSSRPPQSVHDDGVTALHPSEASIACDPAPAGKLTVGGQAVIEGVMMRGPKRWTVTVRRADGSLESQATEYLGWAGRRPFLGRPFVRGAVVLLESMIVGLRALNFSAEIAAGDEEDAKKPKDAEDTGDRPAEKPAPTLGFWTLALTLVSAFALALGLFVALPHAVSVGLGLLWHFDETSGLFHLIDGAIKFALFIGYVWAIGLIPDIGRVYAYHGAEHQAIHTFEAGEPLLPDRAARHPASHPRCGTAFIFLVLALSIVFFAAIFPLIFSAEGASIGRTIFGILLKIVLMLPLAGLAYEVTRLAGRAAPHSFWRLLLWPGLLLQRLTTRPPDERQLEVALDALKRAISPN